MTTFYFHLRSPIGTDLDELGMELPHVEAAYGEACRSIPDIAGDILRGRRNPMECAFVIADARGREVMTVPFDELARPWGA